MIWDISLGLPVAKTECLVAKGVLFRWSLVQVYFVFGLTIINNVNVWAYDWSYFPGVERKLN